MRLRIIHQCSLAVFGLFVPTALWAIGTTPPTWKPRETVATGNDLYGGSDRAIAYDHHGDPGIVFFDDTNGDLRYARRLPGVGWANWAIDTGGVVGERPSLAYDCFERPAISYYDTANEDLKYARFNGTAWQIETIDASGDVGLGSSIAFDSLGRPAIAYNAHYTFNSGGLKFIQDTDGDFSLADETPVTVSDLLLEGIHPSLAFDQLNRPMVAHLQGTTVDLRFSVREPDIGWITTTVESAGQTGHYSSLAIDPDTGYPAIAHYNGTLRYAAWNGATWDTTTVDSTFNNTGSHASLAFDPADGNPAIAYHEVISGTLKFAWHDGSAWQYRGIASGDSPSIAFNEYGNGFPSIAYFNHWNHDEVYFIEDPPGIKVPEPTSVALMLVGLLGTVSPRRNASSAR